jgi:23S rRNA (uracil1939-C5)-methyltransferase
VFVPYTLPAKRWRSRRFPGIPTAASAAVETPSPERIAPVCPAFRRLRRLPDAALGFRPLSRLEARLVLEALRAGGLDAPVGDLIDAHGEGAAARPSTRGAAPTTCSKSASRRIARTTSWRSIAARCSRPRLAGALPAAWALAEALGRGKPLDIQVTATDGGLDVDVRGSGPLGRGMTAALARLAEQHRLARLTRHGEMIVQRATPTVRMGKATGRAAAGRFPAGDRRGRGDAGAACDERVGQGQGQSPTCSAASARSRCGSPSVRASPRPTATRPRSRRCARRRKRRGSSRSPPRRAICSAALAPDELKAFDAVVFDPPRQGARRRRASLRLTRAAGRRGVLQCRDLRARCAHSRRRRLQADSGHAGRSVPLFGACGDRRRFER